MFNDPESLRIQARDEGKEDWSLWGPYLSDRQWGTVREDYSADGDAWTSFPFDHARSRTYRWGEDGLLGISDNNGLLNFAPAFWNGKDPILKERAFGLSNPQGNHGEDIKDYFYHVLNTPTHSFMRGLYKYPQAEFPYRQLIEENARRSREELEYELVDTGIFNEGRYFDIFVEYAKESPEDLAIRLRIINRGPDAAPLTVLPTLWFRNTWAWDEAAKDKPGIHLLPGGHAVVADVAGLPEYHLYADGATEWIFTENETNTQRLYNSPNKAAHVKDAFHDYIVDGRADAINAAKIGTKAAVVYRHTLQPGEEWTIRLRLCRPPKPEPFGLVFDQLFKDREAEVNQFQQSIIPGVPEALSHVMQSALAGLYWCKKFYCYPVTRWLEGDPTMPKPPAERWAGRNVFWRDLYANDVISMPDSWEYPYFCAWDLMFQSVSFAFADSATAKRQNMLLQGERYTSPSAQQPAYEWALSDANPPIGGWAAWRIYSIERGAKGKGDMVFLKKAFNKLLLNYGWWANRVDQTGDNVFEGGFLGLDNIGVFDRRYPLPDGSRIAQSDGTAWMAQFCLSMLNIAVELSKESPEYEDIADKFLNDFIYLAAAINSPGKDGFTLWDEEDGFYYDVLRRPDGTSAYLKTRSVAGLTPLFAVESFDMETVKRSRLLQNRYQWFKKNRPDLLKNLDHLSNQIDGRALVSLVSPERLRRICERLFDENEFLSPHGIRALSKFYEANPYTFTEGEKTETLAYSPADSPVAMFGGNSNWRGPVWMPMNFLIIESLQKFGFYFGDSFKVEFPTGSGVEMNLWEVSLELQKRLVGIFTRGADGRRPFQGGVELFKNDPHWRDLLQFNEYFNGDNGAGVGASHQTGWTALVAKMCRQLHTATSTQNPSAA
ncbi:MAG: MGH1-like glycoside hydrolase domain-containing protein [Terrimicrobiaceae bacterium]